MTSQLENVRKCGKIYRTRLPVLTVVSVADPAAAAKVIRVEPKYILNEFSFPFWNIIARNAKRVLAFFFADGPECYKYRRVLSKRMLRP